MYNNRTRQQINQRAHQSSGNQRQTSSQASYRVDKSVHINAGNGSTGNYVGIGAGAKVSGGTFNGQPWVVTEEVFQFDEESFQIQEQAMLQEIERRTKQLSQLFHQRRKLKIENEKNGKDNASSLELKELNQHITTKENELTQLENELKQLENEQAQQEEQAQLETLQLEKQNEMQQLQEQLAKLQLEVAELEKRRNQIKVNIPINTNNTSAKVSNNLSAMWNQNQSNAAAQPKQADTNELFQASTQKFTNS